MLLSGRKHLKELSVDVQYLFCVLSLTRNNICIITSTKQFQVPMSWMNLMVGVHSVILTLILGHKSSILRASSTFRAW